MRAWLLDSQTGIGDLRLAETPDPVPGPGEVVLQVKFAALNPADRYLAEKQYPGKPSFPHILGRDAAGTVVAVGSHVEGINVGDVRAILRGDAGVSQRGTFAQRVAIVADRLVPIPEGWSLEQAAAAPLVYLTAWQALGMWGKLPAGSVVLISGASGGVGVASVQLSRALGFEVVALSRSESKRAELQTLGATHVIDPTVTGWPKALLKELHGRRVALAIDNIGGTLLPQMIETLGEDGRVSLVGRLAGAVPEFNTATLFFRRLRIGGVSVGAYQTSEAQAAWGEIVRTLGGAGVKPMVDRVFAFDQLPAAFDRLAAGPMGKVLLAIE